PRRKKGEMTLEAETAAPETGSSQTSSQRFRSLSDEEIFQPGRAWYVVHTYSGYEDKVRTNLEQRIRSMEAGDLIYRVVVPFVDESEIRDGQRGTVQNKTFPGSVVVDMTEVPGDNHEYVCAKRGGRGNRAWPV